MDGKFQYKVGLTKIGCRAYGADNNTKMMLRVGSKIHNVSSGINQRDIFGYAYMEQYMLIKSHLDYDKTEVTCTVLQLMRNETFSIVKGMLHIYLPTGFLDKHVLDYNQSNSIRWVPSQVPSWAEESFYFFNTKDEKVNATPLHMEGTALTLQTISFYVFHLWKPKTIKAGSTIKICSNENCCEITDLPAFHSGNAYDSNKDFRLKYCRGFTTKSTANLTFEYRHSADLCNIELTFFNGINVSKFQGDLITSKGSIMTLKEVSGIKNVQEVKAWPCVYGDETKINLNSSCNSPNIPNYQDNTTGIEYNYLDITFSHDVSICGAKIENSFTQAFNVESPPVIYIYINNTLHTGSKTTRILENETITWTCKASGALPSQTNITLNLDGINHSNINKSVGSVTFQVNMLKEYNKKNVTFTMMHEALKKVINSL